VRGHWSNHGAQACVRIDYIIYSSQRSRQCFATSFFAQHVFASRSTTTSDSLRLYLDTLKHAGEEHVKERTANRGDQNAGKVLRRHGAMNAFTLFGVLLQRVLV
jgi:hypothetical protein